MGVKYYINHPVIAIRKLTYFIIASTVGRLLFPSEIFRSIWFNSITSKGWEWVFRGIYNQKIKGINSSVPWPVSPNIDITNYKKIYFNYNDLNNFQTGGCYFQSFGNIYIGKGTYIARNVGLITSNHNLNDLDSHLPPRDIRLGDYCWIGMNSVILPGVELGPHTVVGAGSIVTKSFPDGYCVIVGNPAKIVKTL